MANLIETGDNTVLTIGAGERYALQMALNYFITDFEDGADKDSDPLLGNAYNVWRLLRYGTDGNLS